MTLNVENGYVVSVQGLPDDPEYIRIKNILDKKPTADPSHDYKLNASTLRWNKVKADVSDEEEENVPDDIVINELISILQ